MDSPSSSSDEDSCQFQKFLLNSDILSKAKDFNIFKPGVKTAYTNLGLKLMEQNAILAQQINDLLGERAILKAQFQSQGQHIQPNPKGRYRRSAAELYKAYPCPVSECPRSYGSEGSLTQHIRLKHPNLQDLMNKPLKH